jgi:hypothetical protein
MMMMMMAQISMAAELMCFPQLQEVVVVYGLDDREEPTIFDLHPVISQEGALEKLLS